MRHLETLAKIKAELEKQENVLAMLLFGSVASQTHHEKSDIDLSIVYLDFKPGFEFSTGEVEGIKIGYSKWSFERLKQRVKSSPYRMYVFAHAKLLFDKSNEIKDYQYDLLSYFKSHPGVQREWDAINDNYKKEKAKYGVGQTNIFDVYVELDKKYSA